MASPSLPPMLPPPTPSVMLHVHHVRDIPGDTASNSGIVFCGPINKPLAKHLLAWFQVHAFDVHAEYCASASAALAQYPNITLDVGPTIRADAERIFASDPQFAMPPPATVCPSLPRQPSPPIYMTGLLSAAPKVPPTPLRAAASAAASMASHSHTTTQHRSDPPASGSPKSSPPFFVAGPSVASQVGSPSVVGLSVASQVGCPSVTGLVGDPSVAGYQFNQGFEMPLFFLRDFLRTSTRDEKIVLSQNLVALPTITIPWPKSACTSPHMVGLPHSLRQSLPHIVGYQLGILFFKK
jgi:hypothetical protein